ncbi:acetyltransferase (GNAT) family protein [Micromonospora pisi]|uniref:Acetyltransferase (GNAT) family protein n=1 Tax=Micromonospora pisi TaxID=589240 RepID=A0A495JPE2_9ACTN|nr:GNAT family N-acetyltransferase [Micromonospora pisi]RKR90254.1 acetyltransferase (GNAT) family protein [Micromonospora pisi]
MTAILRPATAADLIAVGGLHARSRQAAYGGFLPDEAFAADSAEQLGRWWSERWKWEQETHLMTVVEAGDRLVGFSYVGPHELDPTGYGELYAIHLEPDQQGRGLGRALMVDALTTLHGRGWRRAALWVLSENAHAREFYQRGGWTADGTTRTEQIGTAPTPQLRYVRDLP